ncbi:unnamed protein product [Porites evermanni]|uniref:Secreted protein n=1 Tax=Porites evermanni TaxID=104178 RepID=A0ABN8LGF6_9CNID|nr:unnamed protein product [Porites evermanni]
MSSQFGSLLSCFWQASSLKLKASLVAEWATKWANEPSNCRTTRPCPFGRGNSSWIQSVKYACGGKSSARLLKEPAQEFNRKPRKQNR